MTTSLLARINLQLAVPNPNTELISSASFLTLARKMSGPDNTALLRLRCLIPHVTWIMSERQQYAPCWGHDPAQTAVPLPRPHSTAMVTALNANTCLLVFLCCRWRTWRMKAAVGVFSNRTHFIFLVKKTIGKYCCIRRIINDDC